MTETAPALVVVMDPEDDVAVTRAALARNEPTHGHLTIHPTPGANTQTALAHDILAALGKPVRAFAEEGLGGESAAWRAAAAWIEGERISQVAALRTHLFTPARWRRLAELPEATGAVVFAFCHIRQLPAAALAGLDGHRYQVADSFARGVEMVSGYLASRPVSEARAAPCDPGESIESVPVCEMPHFRAEARRSLSSAQFALVDAQYAIGREAACAWICAEPQYLEHLTEPAVPPAVFPPHLSPERIEAGLGFLDQQFEISRDELEQVRDSLLCVGRPVRGAPASVFAWKDISGLRLFLSELVAECANAPAAVARVRGAEAGFLLHGLHLALPAWLPRLLGPGLATVPMTASILDVLRTRTADPRRAAAVASAALTGLGPAEVARTAAALDATTLQVRVSIPRTEWSSEEVDLLYAIPPAARGIFRAARSMRERARTQTRGTFSPDPVLGIDGRNLAELADRCGIELPALARAREANSAGRAHVLPWQLHAECWRVAEPIHAAPGAPRDPGLAR